MNIKSVEQRFWPKVQKGLPDECWLWLAAKRGNGCNYGVLKISQEEGDMAAHRFSYELHFGPIPLNMIVCHSCDNPSCVNPNHLFVGTHHDNAMDRERKKRSRTHGLQKLTEKEAAEIKHSDLSQSKLSRIYGVSRRTISDIQKCKTWRHV